MPNIRVRIWFLALVICGSCQTLAVSQNLRLDYLVHRPRQYSPRDPWTVGVVMRNQMGYGGLFYNCDCEEQKRFSPYIEWNRQPCVECNNGFCAVVRQQIDEVCQRVRTGTCHQKQFCLSPGCKLCENYCPPTCNCPPRNGEASGEPADTERPSPLRDSSQQQAPDVQSPSPQNSPNGSPDDTSWMLKLYR